MVLHRAVGGGLRGILALVLVVLPFIVIYDVVFNQEGMEPLKKLFWIVLVLVFNLFGVIAYYLFVYR